MGQAMAQFDNEYTGKDFTASVKSLNPFMDGALTGIFIGSYMQSVTPRLALGMEGVWQRAASNQPPDAQVSYCGKYTGDDWVATGQIQAQGAVNATYWRKLTDRVQAGVELTLQFAGLSGAGRMGMGGASAEGVATVGTKYDFRMSTFRAQVDTTGALSCLLEKRVAPPVTLTFAAQVDHFKVGKCDNSSWIQYLTYSSKTPSSAWQFPLKPAAKNSKISRKLAVVHHLQESPSKQPNI